MLKESIIIPRVRRARVHHGQREGMSGTGPCLPLEERSHILTHPGVPPTRPCAPRPFPRPGGAPLSLGFPGTQSSSGPRLPVLSRPAAKARRLGSRWAPRRPAAGRKREGRPEGQPRPAQAPGQKGGVTEGRSHLVGGALWAGFVDEARS